MQGNVTGDRVILDFRKNKQPHFIFANFDLNFTSVLECDFGGGIVYVSVKSRGVWTKNVVKTFPNGDTQIKMVPGTKLHTGHVHTESSTCGCMALTRDNPRKTRRCLRLAQ